MILGIGFIMVAAVFPVAIKQTEETVEETTAASVAKSGASYFGRIGINANFPPTGGKVVAYTGPGATSPFWKLLSGNLILPTDSRYAWVPFYSRGVLPSGSPAAYAQITMVGVQCRNGPNFTNADLNTIGAQANLQGRPLTATFASGGAGPDTISFTGAPTGAVAEGTYVVVADDSATPNGAANPPVSCNGFIYRVGNLISGNQWELMPGGDMKNARYTPAGGVVQVFVVGRGYNNSASGDATFAGPAMDVGTFSSFIWIH